MIDRKGEAKMAPQSMEFLRMVEKSDLRRIEIANYLGIGERTFYKWQNGEVKIPKTAMMAMYLLVDEPLPEEYLRAKI
jgi:DNA-binding transcriptional regulator YiaG